MGKRFKAIVIVLIVMVLGISFYFANAYGFFEYLKMGRNRNTVKTAGIVVELDDNSSLEISEDNAYPLSDETGRSLKPYVFTLKNMGPLTSYNVKIINDDDKINEDGCGNNLLSNVSLRYQLIRDGNIVSEKLLSNTTDNIIDTGAIANKEETVYELRIWIDKDAGIEIMNKHFHGKIQVEIE